MLGVQMGARFDNDLRLEWIVDPKPALARIREVPVDAVLIGETSAAWSKSATGQVSFVDAVQTLDSSVAVVVLVALPDDRLLAELSERECDLCISPRMWDSPALPAILVRAVRRRQQLHELQRLTAAHERRLSREQTDAESVLRLQQGLLRGLAQPSATNEPTATWSEHYDELLKAAVLSGPARLKTPIAEFAEELLAAKQEPRAVLAWHIERLRALSDECGGRTSQHVVLRADLLALELMAQLGEGYQRRAGGVSPRSLDISASSGG